MNKVITLFLSVLLTTSLIAQDSVVIDSLNRTESIETLDSTVAQDSIINRPEVETKKSLNNSDSLSKNQESRLTDWQKGFFSGLVATIIGFLFTMAWDLFKNYRDKTQKDKTINRLILDTLNENQTYIIDDLDVLSQELEALKTRSSVIIGIKSLTNDYWDLIKLNIPKNLLDDNNLLGMLQKITRMTKEVNENINSREMYRLNNGAMDNFSTRMNVYDDHLVQIMVDLYHDIAQFIIDYEKTIANKT